MDREREIKDLFDRVWDCAPEEWARLLVKLCPDDEALRDEVMSLLRAQSEAGGFLETPPFIAGLVEREMPLPDFSGRRIGNYELQRVIGRGGMATVYLAVRIDDEFRQQVAVKLIQSNADTEDVIRRFKQERQILADLNHPNIARLLDGGTTGEGWPFLVMEYIEGQPITAYCRERRLAIRERLALFQTVCAAVAYAHRHLIIHRDLKPGNILVTAEGAVKLLDFGVAKVLAPESESPALTRAGLHWLTPDYASPEQMREEKVTTASDVYSLGVLLYELLTGAPPLNVRNQALHEAIHIVCEQAPSPPGTRIYLGTGIASLRRRERGDLDAIVLKALRKDARHRYQNVEQLSEDIGRHLNGEPVLARKGDFFYNASLFVRGNKFVLLLLAALLVATIAAWRRAGLVEEAALRERRLLYASQMRQAGYDLEEGNSTRLRATLENFAGDGKLRGFEWHYLWRQLHRGRSELRHPGWVYALAYSPDGQKLAAACEDGSVRIWDAAAGRELFTIEGHDAFVWTIAFSPDGSRIASGGEDGVMKLWDAATGCGLIRWKSPHGQVHSLAFSPDGDKLLMGTDDDLVLMEAASQKILLTLTHEGGVIFATAFLPDGRRFLSAGIGGWVRMWDAATGRQLSSIEAHPKYHVFSLAVSADGRRLASSGGDRMARLWDTATGKEVAAFAGHTNAVRGVAFSPDERRLVTASADRTVKLWDIATKKQLRVFRGHTGRIRDVAFSPDGRHIASCGDDRTVNLWDLKAWEDPPDTIAGHTERIFSLAYSPDGWLATASSDKTAKTWNPATGRERATFAGHGAELYSVAFSSDGQKLATASMDGAVRLWNTAAGQVEKIFRRRLPLLAFAPDGKAIAGAENGSLLVLANPETGEDFARLESRIPNPAMRWRISANGRQAVAGASGASIHFWDVQAWRESIVENAHSAPLDFVRVSPDGSRALSGATDGELKLWDAGAARMLVSFRRKNASPSSWVFFPNGGRAIIGDRNHRLTILDAMNGRELMRLSGHSATVRVAEYSPDGRMLATGGNDQTVKLWDAVTGKELTTLGGHAGHSGWIYGVAFSPDGQLLASVGGDRMLKLWDLKTRREIKSIECPAPAGAVLFSPDGRRVLTADYAGGTILWDAATGRRIAAHQQFPEAGSAVSAAFSPDGKLLAAGYDTAFTALWDVGQTRLIALLKGHSNTVWAVRFSPDGKRLATASWDGVAKLWEVPGGRELLTFKGHNGPITAAAFSPEGRLLATGSDDHTVKLWDAATGRESFTLAGHADQVLTAAFSPDGRRLATGSTDQTIRIWDVETGLEILALRGHTDEVWSVAFSPDGKTLASASWDKTVRLWRGL